MSLASLCPRALSRLADKRIVAILGEGARSECATTTRYWLTRARRCACGGAALSRATVWSIGTRTGATSQSRRFPTSRRSQNRTPQERIHPWIAVPLPKKHLRHRIHRNLPPIEEQHPIRHLPREAHFVGDHDHGHA